MTVKNPILRGFHPDPSVVRVGADYYLATSTFEWWPGVDIYHSRDLVNWEWVCAPLKRASQADLRGDINSGGIWAPHLSHGGGKFWLAYTDVKSCTAFKDTLNYLITAPDIAGPWSEPVFVTASGFDPALFHDDDGRHYFLNMLFDWRPGRPSFAGTVIQEFDTRAMRLIGSRRHFYRGTGLGVCEGPQILKKDGYYYLLCAAGGTGYGHAATVARSRALLGPYEEPPRQPLLTARDDPHNPLQKSGHACFVQMGEEWYITHLCARPLTQRGCCPLGRETALQKIEWANGWPRLANGTCHPDLMVPAPAVCGEAVQREDFSERLNFAGLTALPPTLKSLRGPLERGRDYDFLNGTLRLYGGQSLSSYHRQSLLARRWQSLHFRVQTCLRFSPDSFQQMAGLILYYDTQNWFYALLTREEEGQNTLRVLACDNDRFSCAGQAVPLPDSGAPLTLAAEVAGDMAQFYFAPSGQPFAPLGEALPAWHLSDDYIEQQRGRCAFTGAMAGICCQDMDAHRAYADFYSLSYQESRA